MLHQSGHPIRLGASADVAGEKSERAGSDDKLNLKVEFAVGGFS